MVPSHAIEWAEIRRRKVVEYASRTVPMGSYWAVSRVRAAKGWAIFAYV